jgi:hypothetical protein
MLKLVMTDNKFLVDYVPRRQDGATTVMGYRRSREVQEFDTVIYP